jgi:hypothetical protein
MDGEAVVTGADGVAVFDALHRRHKATNAMLYAFGAACRGKVGRNKATILTSCLRPRDANRSR